MPTYVDLLRQAGQQIQNNVGPNSPVAQGAEQAGNTAFNAKQAALRQLAGAPAPLAAPQAVQPNTQSMTPQDAESRMNAMITAPVAMDKAAAKLRAQANQDDAAEAHANALSDENMTGYSDYKPQEMTTQKFQQLRQQIQPKATPNVRAQTSATKALTPEQEAALYPQDEDEDDEGTASAGVKQTGTLGGV
jgi:hypothetical protein